MIHDKNNQTSIFGFIGFLLAKPRSALAIFALALWLLVTLMFMALTPDFNRRTAKADFISTDYWLDGGWRYPAFPDLKQAFRTAYDQGWVVTSDGKLLSFGAEGKGINHNKLPELNAVYFVDAKRGWAVGENGKIVFTQDGGEHWTVQQSWVSDSLFAVRFVDENVGWAVGYDGTIVATRDSGEHWKNQTSTVNASLISVFFVTRQRGWILGSDGEILSTSDGGEHWSLLASNAKTRINSLYFFDENHGWAVDTEGNVMITRDGGAHWTAQRSPVNAQLTAIYFTDPTYGWAVGHNGAIIDTSDGGAHWTARDSNTDVNLASVHFFSNNYGWAVGDNGTLLVTENGGASWSTRLIASAEMPAWYWLLSLICAMVFLAGLVGIRSPSASDAISAMLSTDRPRQGREADALGAKALAWALSRFLRHQHTQPPLTIAINAPWGGGKSSLMNWLREDLLRFGFRPAWFNAWHYEKQEQMFPALLETIRQQAVPPWFSMPGWRFRRRLLWHRAKESPAMTILLLVLACFPIGYFSVNHQAVWEGGKHQITVTLERAFPKQLAADQPGAEVNPTKTNTAQVATDVQAAKPASKEDSDKLVGLLGLFPGLAPLLGLWKGLQSFSNPGDWLGRWLNPTEQSKATRETAYRAQFARDFRAVTRALDRTLVIFIDDLDRCQPKSVCEVMETLNFLASEGSCHMILGIWREGVERAIGLGFAEAAQEFANIGELQVGEAGLNQAEIRRRYGQLYLEKLVNIWVSVPGLDAQTAQAILKGKGESGASKNTDGVYAKRDWRSALRALFSAAIPGINAWAICKIGGVQRLGRRDTWRGMNWVSPLSGFWRSLWSGFWAYFWLNVLGGVWLFILLMFTTTFPDWYNQTFDLLGQRLGLLGYSLYLALPGLLLKLTYRGAQRWIGWRLPATPPSPAWFIKLLLLCLIVWTGAKSWQLGVQWTGRDAPIQAAELDNLTDAAATLGDTGAMAANNAKTAIKRAVNEHSVVTDAPKPPDKAEVYIADSSHTELGWRHLGALVIVFLIGVEWLRFRMEWPSDSPAFEEALQFWSPVLAKRFDTPRRLKRFLNHLRFNAMRLRTLEKPDQTLLEQFWNRHIRGEHAQTAGEDEMQGKESGLLLLSVLEACCGPDFRTKAMLMAVDGAVEKMFQRGWADRIVIDAQLLAENGKAWGEALHKLLIERLRYFEANQLPQPTMSDLRQFEAMVPARITPASVRSAGLTEQAASWDRYTDRRSRDRRTAASRVGLVTADRRSGLDRRQSPPISVAAGAASS